MQVRAEQVIRRNVSLRFVIDFYALVAEWARWAHIGVETWPEEPRHAVADQALIRDDVERAEAAASALDTPKA